MPNINENNAAHQVKVMDEIESNISQFELDIGILDQSLPGEEWNIDPYLTL